MSTVNKLGKVRYDFTLPHQCGGKTTKILFIGSDGVNSHLSSSFAQGTPSRRVDISCICFFPFPGCHFLYHFSEALFQIVKDLKGFD